VYLVHFTFYKKLNKKSKFIYLYKNKNYKDIETGGTGGTGGTMQYFQGVADF
jgi:hypothetical protein